MGTVSFAGAFACSANPIKKQVEGVEEGKIGSLDAPKNSMSEGKKPAVTGMVGFITYI